MGKIMHNSLRRMISELKSEGGAAVYPMLADTLLARALTALGGPVEDNRPKQVASMAEARRLQSHGLATTLIGRDLGDEDESEYQSGLGAPLPQDEPRVEEFGSLASDTKTPLA